MKYISILYLGATLICTWIITNTIEKHSVHPVYGNYKRVDSNRDRCSPWEACK